MTGRWLALGLAAAAMLAPPAAAAGDFVYVWASDVGAKRSDFLAVIDANPTSPRYAEIVATAPTGVANGDAHHTEHEMPVSGILFANGFGAGRTYRFDLHDPLKPRVLGSFGEAGEYMHPHSFARTPAGTVLATYQMRGHDNSEAGALVELSADGGVLRTSAAADPKVEPFIRPYSLVVVPALDRVVTTSADMHEKAVSRAVQVWRVSDLKLIKTVMLPPGANKADNADPAEPRVLADGKTVVVSTFNCGLFLLDGLAGESPSARAVGAVRDGAVCALSAVSGNYWIVAGALSGLVAFDVRNPARPVEVSRLALPDGHAPHWIALAPDRRRIVVSGGKGPADARVLMARIDPATGKLSFDASFRDKGGAGPGVSFDRKSWPHGDTGKAVPHGAVFSRP